MVWIIGHLLHRHAADYKAVHSIQNKYSLTPLSAYGKRYTSPRGTVDPNVDMRTSGREQVNRLDAASYFKMIAEVMKANPPAAADGPMIAKLAKIGIVPGQDFDPGKLDPAVVKGLQGVPQAAQEKIMAHDKNVGVKVNGWTFMLKTGVYGTDYLLRALVAAVGLGANLPQDAVYPLTQVDEVTASCWTPMRYVLHPFPGQTPPAKASGL
jgi:hypothetical protein